MALCSAGQFADALPLVAPLLDDSALPNDQRAEAFNTAGACSFALGQWASACGRRASSDSAARYDASVSCM
ncbi:hypothetical protein F6X37_10905 [Paraburkholderia sp. 31.1]|uniref:hypothetical protein n=1 Tax=Paraburkholderia sp. 31.1 TaxID=2615205 RepID=UPI00165606B1|nr:hypothetical protein [Paraburkholderia sp. 31.1]MBC8722086.1 hypothetical protein [Paraburkholderia sp. 31.1]